jgi:hypothetical protein
MILYLLGLDAGDADALAGRKKLAAMPTTAITVVTAFSCPQLNMDTSFAGAAGSKQKRNHDGESPGERQVVRGQAAPCPASASRASSRPPNPTQSTFINGMDGQKTDIGSAVEVLPL